MEHPFVKLKPEYSQLLSVMIVRPECRGQVDKVAQDVLKHRVQFEQLEAKNGVPLILSGPSFYREASLNFALSPAQGDPWNRVSIHVPAHRGPFRSWLDAAIDAYHLNGLDKIGKGNWTWELICFYAEMFNGFGYRDWHHEHSPYLWGGTNIQQRGKYPADGKFDPYDMDTQLGVVPIAKRIVEIAPELAPTTVIPPPQPSGLGTADTDMKWAQESLNLIGFHPPLQVNGSFDKATKHAADLFEKFYGLKQDGGYIGPEVIGALKEARARLDPPKTEIASPAPALAAPNKT